MYCAVQVQYVRVRKFAALGFPMQRKVWFGESPFDPDWGLPYISISHCVTDVQQLPNEVCGGRPGNPCQPNTSVTRVGCCR
jgi:hypothetical protein